jgi:hypothetical protein
MISWTEWKLRRIAKRLTHFELQESENTELSLADLEGQLQGGYNRELFLNFYTKKGLESALKEYGTWSRLEALGFQPCLTIRPLDSRVDLLRITHRDTEGPILIEIQARQAFISSKSSFGMIQKGDTLKLLGIEWLMMQNPHEAFSSKRPPLPGQDYPGLGMGQEISILLGIMAERLKLEGVLGFPQHYHNGKLYQIRFHFVSPQREGELLALNRDLKSFHLSTASWAVQKSWIFEKASTSPYLWRGEEMIWPISERLRFYFSDRSYQEQVQERAEKLVFEYDPALLKTVEQHLLGDPLQAKNLIQKIDLKQKGE